MFAKFSFSRSSQSGNYQFYFDRACQKKKQRDYQEAIFDYTIAIFFKPDDALAFYNRGFAKDELGDYQGAIADYSEAIRLNPNYALAFYYRGAVKGRLVDYQGAIADYSEAIRLNPDYALAFNNRGIAKFELGDYQAAIADYSEAIRLNPDDALAFNNRGIAKFKLGDYQAAIAEYNKAIRLKPDDVNAYIYRGFAKDKLEDYQGAISDYEKVLELMKGDCPEAVTCLAKVHAKLQAKDAKSAPSTSGSSATTAKDKTSKQQALDAQLSTSTQWAKALYSFAGVEGEDMLAFQAEDVLEILEMKTNRWWLARHGKQTGYIPGTYVQLISQPRLPFPLNPEELKPQINMADASPSTSTSLAVISYDKLKFSQSLGRGSYGEVFKGEYQFNPVAIKKLVEQGLHLQAQFQQETALLMQLRSPYLIQMYGGCFTPGQYCLVMEYAPKGSLAKLLRYPNLCDNKDQQAIASWPIRYQMAVNLSCGLAYLHSQNIIHGDIKSDNILVDNHYQAKLGDFGCAKVQSNTMTKTLTGPSWAGTTRWMAPEVIDDAPISKESDVYSYGMVLWELGSRKIPYEGRSEAQVRRFVCDKNGREDITPDTPPQMAKLIARCWEQRAEARPSAAEAITLLTEEQQQLYDQKLPHD